MKAARTAIAGLFLAASTLVGIASYEGYTDHAVIPVPGDVPTIGHGTTKGVKMGDTITPTRALIRLLDDASKCERALKECIAAPLYPHEFGAYVSLAYNVGAGAVCNSSIPGKLAAGQYEAACKTILDFNGFKDRSKPKVQNPKTGKWDYPHVVLRGLAIRRQAEYQQCMGGIQDANMGH